jgi:hypothetical protein
MATNLQKGDKVIVMDQGLIMLYNTMKSFDPKAKPLNQGWVNEVCEDGTIMVTFPIGDDDAEDHSQVSPYPANRVVRKDW